MSIAVPLEVLEALLKAEKYDILLALLDEQCAGEEADHRHFELMARALYLSGRNEDALNAAQMWTLMTPDPTEALLMISHLHFTSDDPALCLEAAQAAIEHAKGSNLERVYGMICRALQALGRFKEAEEIVDNRLALMPDSADLCFAKALICSHIGEAEKACAYYRNAHEQDPNWFPPKVELANELFRLGQYHEAVEAYEARWEVDEVKIGGVRHQTIPLWDGTDFDGTLLLWREQGLGDEIFGLGFLEWIRRLHPLLIVEVDPRILLTCVRSFPGIRFAPLGANLSSLEINYSLPFGSIPRILVGRRIELPILRHAYLTAPSPLRSPFASLPSSTSQELKIGLAWRSDRGLIGKFKSINLNELRPILSRQDCHFVSLQHGDTETEIKQVIEDGININIAIPELDLFNDIDELAALIASLDAVIAVSSSVAHLAAALGVPTYLLLPKGRGLLWYWERGMSRSSWYEGVQLFRQDESMNWKPAVEQLARAFSNDVGHKKKERRP